MQFSQILCALSQARHTCCVSTSALGHFGAARRVKDVWMGLLYPLGVTDYYGIILLIPDLAWSSTNPSFCTVFVSSLEGKQRALFQEENHPEESFFFLIFIQNTSQQGCKLLSWIKDGGLLSALHYSTHHSAVLRSWLSICHMNALTEQPPYSLHYQYLSLPCDLFNPFYLSAIKAPCTSPFIPQGLSGRSWSSSSGLHTAATVPSLHFPIAKS